MPAQSWVASFVNHSQCQYVGKETLPTATYRNTAITLLYTGEKLGADETR